MAVDGRTSRFLHLCLQAGWRSDALGLAGELATRSEIDWEGLLHTARAGGVAPLLYRAARGEGLLPPALEQTLRMEYFANAQRNVLLFRELEEVLEALDAAGIPTIVLKGAALAETVYENVAVRPMGDVDLLVRPEAAAAAVETLSKLGYAEGEGEHFDVRDIHANQVMLIRRQAPQMVVEIHWQLFWFPYYQRAIPTDWFWETSVPVQVSSVRSRALGNEAQVLHLCGHLLHHHGSEGDFRLLWLHDVAAFIAYAGSDIDWSALMDCAQGWDLIWSLQQVLSRVYREWRAPIPTDAMKRMREMTPSREERLALRGLTAVTNSMDRYALASLAGLPTWWERFRFVWHDLLFPSVGFMRRRYSIPHPLLVPLYYPYRWVAGLWGVVGSSRD